MSQHELNRLKSVLSQEEIIEPTDSRYDSETLTWAHQREYKSKLVIRPGNVDSLKQALVILSTGNLDWNVRSQGYGSASAKDVLLSMTAFDNFEWDGENEVVYLGAGQPWREYYRKMEEAAPDYQVVAVRVPALGVGGSTLCGGISWLSFEYGLLSDPMNMLDAQVVTLDGRVLWASEDPELLWALRGSGGGFGIVTQFKFQARRYPRQIWAGPIILPKSALRKVAEGVSAMTRKPRVPQMSMFLLALPWEALGLETGKEYLMVQAYDALGEEHAQSEEGFKWAMDIPGAQVWAHTMTLREYALAGENISANVGKSTFYGSPVVLDHVISPETVVEAFDWFDGVRNIGPSFAKYSILVFELFSLRQPLDAGQSDTAWPRPEDASHYIMLSAGCEPGTSKEQEEQAVAALAEAPAAILGASYPRRFVPNFVETFRDMRATYGQNYNKLKGVKQRYDPTNRLPSTITA